MHRCSFPETSAAKITVARDIQLSSEKPSVQPFQPQGLSFADHLQSASRESAELKTEPSYNEKKTPEAAPASDVKKEIHKESAPQNESSKNNTLKTDDAHEAVTKDGHAIVKDSEEKKASLAEIAVKKAAESHSADQTKKSSKKKSDSVSEMEQGLAALITAVDRHTSQLSVKKQDSSELAAQRNDIALKIKTLKQQITKASEESVVPVEDKRTMQKAQKFLAQLEQLLKNPAAKEFKKENLAGISDSLKKELNTIRENAEKQSKPRIADIVHHDIRNEKPADASAKETSPQKENGVQGIASSSASSKNESDSSSQFSFMKNASGRDTASSVKDSFPAQTKPFPFSENIDDLISKAKVAVRDAQNGSLSLRMFPEHLGRVNINLGLENGILTAKFLVDSADAKEALNANMTVLKDALSQEGINLGQFQVDVRGGGSSQAQNDENFNKNAPLASTSEQERASKEYDIRHASAHNGLIDMVI